MNIDRLLEIIAIAGWTIFAVVTLVPFVYAARRDGLQVAARGLLSLRMWLSLLVVVGITVASASLIFIEPQEVGVVISVLESGGIRVQPLRAGIGWIVPLAERVIKYPISWQIHTMSRNPMEGQALGDDSITARTSDGQEVFIDCSIIFRVDPEQVVRIHKDWQDRYVQDFIRPMVRGVVRTEVSQFKVDEINSSKRRDLEMRLADGLRLILEDKGLILDAFVLRNIAFSPEYAASVEQKQVALEGATRSEYEANQVRRLAEGQAYQVRILASSSATATVARARGEAEARIIQADAEAQALQLVADVLAQNPDLLTYQYITKLSPNIRVMLLPSDAPFILPLPDLDSAETIVSPSISIQPPPPALTSTETLTPTTPAEAPAPTTP